MGAEAEGGAGEVVRIDVSVRRVEIRKQKLERS